MEETKVKKTKEVEEAKENKKLSYEELENVCHQLSEQARVLYQKLQSANLENSFKRLDYLFEVVKSPEVFKDSEDFYKACKEELIAALTVPETPETKEEKAE